jgi:GDP-L-fucose synthase
VEVWGTGSASREFLYVDDAARGIILATEHYNKSDPINLGAGMEITICDLVDLIKELTNYTSEIRWDTSKPDGQPKRSLDVSRAQKEFGFTAKMPFREGLIRTIEWYEAHSAQSTLYESERDYC